MPDFLTKAWNWAIHIPFAVWDRSQGVPEQASGKIKHKWRYRWTLSPIPFNPLGADHVEYNQTFEAAGYVIALESASYSGMSLSVVTKVISVPQDRAANVLPVAAIVAGIGAIIGGIIVIALLTKVEAILSLPVIPLLLIVILLVMVLPQIQKSLKKGG